MACRAILHATYFANYTERLDRHVWFWPHCSGPNREKFGDGTGQHKLQPRRSVDEEARSCSCNRWRLCILQAPGLLWVLLVGSGNTSHTWEPNLLCGIWTGVVAVLLAQDHAYV